MFCMLYSEPSASSSLAHRVQCASILLGMSFKPLGETKGSPDAQGKPFVFCLTFHHLEFTMNFNLVCVGSFNLHYFVIISQVQHAHLQNKLSPQILGSLSTCLSFAMRDAMARDTRGQQFWGHETDKKIYSYLPQTVKDGTSIFSSSASFMSECWG